MIRALAIVGAIVTAWISGVGAASEHQYRNEGAAVFLIVAILCGIVAYGM